jgi:hypothetical protein
MKNLIVAVVIVLGFTPVFAQTKDVYVVTKYEINGIDYSTDAVYKENILIIYQKTKDQSSSFFFKNLWIKNKTYSDGRIEFTKSEVVEETTENYGGIILSFNWYFHNSYDSEYGVAKVDFIKYLSNDIHKFICEISIEETGDVIKMEGFMKK